VKEILIVEHLAVKTLQAHPHSMGAWSADSKVEAMKNGDFLRK
jgi:monomeric isocitrate dehydrogenase